MYITGQNKLNPMSIKTGLNDIDIKVEITTSLESIGLSKCFLKIGEHLHYLLRCNGGFRIIQVVMYLYMTLLTSCKYVLTSTS